MNTGGRVNANQDHRRQLYHGAANVAQHQDASSAAERRAQDNANVEYQRLQRSSGMSFMAKSDQNAPRWAEVWLGDSPVEDTDVAKAAAWRRQQKDAEKDKEEEQKRELYLNDKGRGKRKRVRRTKIRRKRRESRRAEAAEKARVTEQFELNRIMELRTRLWNSFGVNADNRADVEEGLDETSFVGTVVTRRPLPRKAKSQPRNEEHFVSMGSAPVMTFEDDVSTSDSTARRSRMVSAQADDTSVSASRMVSARYLCECEQDGLSAS